MTHHAHSEGIVLHSLKYSDNRLIVTIYTRDFGRKAYFTGAGKSKRNGTRANLFQPMNLLELELVHKPNREIQEIREAKLLVPLHRIALHPVNRSIALFMAEVMYRFVREEEANPGLFEYLRRSVLFIEEKQEGLSHFPLFFLIHLGHFSGFSPGEGYSKHTPWFDLRSGEFCGSIPPHAQFLDQETSHALFLLQECPSDELESLSLPGPIRRKLLARLIDYFRIQLGTSAEIQSVEVLNAVFS